MDPTLKEGDNDDDDDDDDDVYVSFWVPVCTPISVYSWWQKVDS